MDCNKRDTYRIPGTELFICDYDDKSAICYAPLADEIFLIDIESASQMKNRNPEVWDVEIKEFVRGYSVTVDEAIYKRYPPIDKTPKLSLIPNSICNLECSYCYSASGRNNTRISTEKLMSVLRWFIDKERVETDRMSIFITGGGEPFATRDLTLLAVKYARQLAYRENIALHISIVTNGTLLDDRIIDFLKRNDCSVCVSFDILKDLQDAQRGKFETVKANIKKLLEAGIRVMINSTVIPSSVARIAECVEEVAHEYPGVVQLTMEPATGVGIFRNTLEMRDFYSRFEEEYYRAKSLAEMKGINLRFTFDDALRGISTRHCPGKFVLTPSGNISVCHLVSSEADERMGECTYGKVENGKVELDLEKFQNLYHCNLFSYSECGDCIAKWSCGGECYTRRNTYPQEFMYEVCRFNRNIIKRQLREKVKDVSLA